MTTVTLRAGMRVRIPAHGVAGSVVHYSGEAPDRLVGVEMADGEVITVREGDLVPDDAPPPTAPEPSRIGFDLVAFARALIRRTAQARDEECQALNALARGYLVATGRSP